MVKGKESCRHGQWNILLKEVHMDIKTEVLKYLNFVKNKYNAESVERYIKNIDYIVKSLAKDQSKFESGELNLWFKLEEFFDDLILTEVFRDGSISLMTTRWLWKIQRSYKSHRGDIQHSILLERPNKKMSEEEAIELTKQVAKVYNRKYTEINELNIPTGELIFANFFLDTNSKYLFDIDKKIKYEDEYSINNKFGRQNCMDYLAKHHNLGYVQLGNTSCDIYKVNEDKIYITATWFEDKNGKDILPPAEWQRLGSICCDVWRVEFVDNSFLATRENFNRERFNKMDNVVANVAPGKWTVRNYYGDRSDKSLAKKFGYPVWVELNRIKE